MRTPSAPLTLALILALLGGCSAPSSHTSAVQLAVSVPQALSSADVTRVKVTVSASDMSSIVVELVKTNGSWGGLIGNLVAGSNRTFLAQAFDSAGTLIFQGQTSGVSLSANQTTAVALTLQQVSPPTPYGNEAPIIDSLVASGSSVQTGASITLTATAHDPNVADTLTFAWTASAGTFSAPSAATSSWTAPASAGLQTITLTVMDSQRAAVSVSLSINVVSGAATGNAAPNISFNLWPTVSRISSSLNRLDVGQSTAVSALAADADGDALTYQWTASCPGTWTNASSSSASFAPSSIPTGACNNCRLTVTVQDGRGGQTTGVLSLCVATVTTTRFPPRFTNYYQSATSTTPGQTVTFDITALDPQSSALRFAWTATTGSLGAPASDASTSHVVWTAPACAVSGITPSISATVTNAFNLTTTRSFVVTGLPVCTTPGWNATTPMLAGRVLHTATRLLNGMVLISSGPWISGASDMYDPALGTWTATGSMSVSRYSHTATLLPNGKVLAAGGATSANASLSTAEVYDPATSTWTATGSMASLRSNHTATLLPNGKVLVAGGYDRGSNYKPTALAEVYDPATGTWTAAGSMVTARDEHTATLLPNGKVLVAGGHGVSGAVATSEVYDPATSTWTLVGSMAGPRYMHTAALLANGKVLVAGGYNGSNDALATAEVYDPATGTWSATGSMPSPHGHRPTATLLADGRVLVAGGYAGSAALKTVAVYQPSTGVWVGANPMISDRYCHTATQLPNGTVLVTGGYNTGASMLSAAEVYTP